MLLVTGSIMVLNSCKEKDPDPVAPAAPTNLAFDDVKDVTAVLTWAGEATTYEVAVGDAAAVPVTGKKYTATSLTPETAYAWKVRAKAGDLFSDWVDGPEFTTTEEIVLPDAPTNLNVDDITETSAVFTWEGTTTSYEINVGSIIQVVDAKTFTATTLTAATNYAWKVRAKDGDVYSAWVDGDSFTTEGNIEAIDWEMPNENFEVMSEYFDSYLGTIDADNDGISWNCVGFVDENNVPTGEYGIVSNSWANGVVLFPDNYLLTPELSVGAGAQFQVEVWATDPNWYAETISVVISKTPITLANCADAETLLTYTLTTASKHTKEVDIPATYVGRAYVAIRHHDSSDQFNVVVNGMSLTNGTASAPAMLGGNRNTAPSYAPAYRR